MHGSNPISLERGKTDGRTDGWMDEGGNVVGVGREAERGSERFRSGLLKDGLNYST